MAVAFYLSIGIVGRALATRDDHNVASIRTIGKNGGILEDVIIGPDLDKPQRRYWIDARAGAA
jgi:predicted acetyltransferase